LSGTLSVDSSWIEKLSEPWLFWWSTRHSPYFVWIIFLIEKLSFPHNFFASKQEIQLLGQGCYSL
jgi:hypothetical protein